MGQELECRMRYRNRTLSGKAYLETDFLLFRGDQRVKIPFQELTAVHARDGLLLLEFAGGPAELELGKAAEKWAGKILHPPTRADKLGVKPEIAVRLIGEFDDGFREELRLRGAVQVEGRGKAGLVFLEARTTADLAKLPKLVAAIQPDGGIWVVYPKGMKEIREIEVIEAGRAAGLKDVKVAAFSSTQTALKFVIPLARRGPEDVRISVESC